MDRIIYMKNGRIDYSKIKVKEDVFIVELSHIFNIYFDYTLDNIVRESYLKIIRNRYDFQNEKLKEQLDLAYDKAYRYIEERLK